LRGFETAGADRAQDLRVDGTAWASWKDESKRAVGNIFDHVGDEKELCKLFPLSV
jgi:hypothetical protein